MKSISWFARVFCLVCVLLAACTQPSTPAAPVVSTQGAPAQAAPANTKAPEPTKAAPASTVASGPTQGGTLVVGLVADPVTLDPHSVTENNTRRSVYAMFDPLVRESADKIEVEPALAERWEASSDGLVYTFYLRKGVKFHDGEPFNAEAVKFNIERQIDPNNPYFKDGNYLFMRLFLSPLQSAEVVDEYTVRLKLKAPYAPFLDHLGTCASYMISPKSVKELGKGVAEKPVGTGPFRFVSWEKGQRLVLERNPDYWGEKAKLDKLIFVPIKEAQGRLTALQTGEVDFTIDLAPDAIGIVRSSPNLMVAEKPSRQFWSLTLSNKFEPFTKTKVRQAISYAINREALTKDVLKGTGVPAKGPFSDVFGDFVAKDVRVYNYDPEKAKQLLAEAGYPNGFEVTFLTSVSGSGQQQPVPMAEYIQSNLAAVGIKVKLETVEWATFIAKWNVGDYQMSSRGVTGNSYDPDNYLNTFFNSINFPPQGLNNAFWKNEEYDSVAMASRLAIDPKDRLQKVYAAQKILLEEVPWTYIDHEIDLYYMNKKVNGFQIRGNFLVDWNKVWLGAAK